MASPSAAFMDALNFYFDDALSCWRHKRGRESSSAVCEAPAAAPVPQPQPAHRPPNGQVWDGFAWVPDESVAPSAPKPRAPQPPKRGPIDPAPILSTMATES